MNRTVSILLISLLAAACQPAMNQAMDDTGTRAREIISKEIETNEFPGLQYIILDKDSTLFSFAGGLADISANRAVHESTTMMIYSMTKTITAAAVLQLVERGKLSLDDPAAKYLPDIPYGHELKIRHLLAQTSGIPNPIPLKWVHLSQEHARFDQQAALREIMEEHAELKFAPGEKYGYSNISYWLLGSIVEKASGTSFEEYVREHIFRKLGIPGTEIDFIIPSPGEHAKGYLPKWSFINLVKSFVIDEKFVGEYEEDWLHINDHYLNGPAFGGVVASARAVAVFLQDQLRENPRLFASETKSLYFQQQKDNDGEPVEMTLGWHVGERDGVRYFFKEGGGGGFHCEMRIYAAAGLASVVIANNTSFNTGSFLNSVDGEFLNRQSR